MSGCEDRDCFWCVKTDKDKYEWCALAGVPCLLVNECTIVESKEKE